MAGQSGLLSLLLTWPLALYPGRFALGSADADTMKHLWTIWHFRHRLLEERSLSLATKHFNFPEGMELWPIEPLNLLGAIVLFPCSLVLAANLLALLNFTLTGLCGCLLGRELSRSDMGGHLAGLLLQTSSFALFSLSVGVGELRHLWLLPLGFWFMLRLVRGQRWRDVVGTGLVLGLGTLACFYYAFFLALGLLVLGIWALLEQRKAGLRELLLRLVAAASLSLALVLPIVMAFSHSYGPIDEADSALGSSFTGELRLEEGTEPESARLQVGHLVFGRSSAHKDATAAEQAYGGGRLLAAPALLLACIALVRRPRKSMPWLLVALLGILLALGSHGSWSDGPVLRLPFFYLNRALGWVAEPLHFPVRFLALPQVCLAALGSLALAGLSGRRAWGLASLGLLAAADVQLRQFLPTPLPASALPQLEILQQAEDEPEGAVLDLAAAWWEDRETRYQILGAQAIHQRPIQAVPIERLELHYRQGRWFSSSLPLVVDLRASYRRLPVPLEGTYDEDFFLLREAGFSHIMLLSFAGRPGIPVQLMVSLERLAGRPVVQTEQVVLYRIPQVQASAEQAAAWRAAQAQRVAQAREADLGRFR